MASESKWPDMANEMSTVDSTRVGWGTRREAAVSPSLASRSISSAVPRQIEDRRGPVCIRAPFRSAGRPIRSEEGKRSASPHRAIQDVLRFAANPDLPNWGIRRTDLAVLVAPDHPIGSDTHRQKVSTGPATAQRETNRQPARIMRRKQCSEPKPLDPKTPLSRRGCLASSRSPMNSCMCASKSCCLWTHLKIPANPAARAASPNVTMPRGQRVLRPWI